MLVDSHCHIDFPDFAEGVAPLLANMQQAGVGHALCVSVTLEDYPRVLALAEAHANLFASVGVHPDHQDYQEPTVDQLVELAKHPKVVAIGETGLDYYRLPRAEVDWQRARFRTHIRAARQAGKPLIIHTRSAADDTLAIMREAGAGEAGGVMHCFTESWDVARQALELGFYISFSGIVTFKSAADLREVARQVPLDRLLVETDSPYLAPVPHRGKRNEPAYVRQVAELIAQVRGVSVEAVVEATTGNFFRLFSAARS
ncbi:TatD DNase family protein [Sulfuritortus calidifontis]|uniref:TatD DNase family protein n=1 Tax=Sulfuritortus calidifontis TaxID=1914471 RepID=A0A4R3JWP6_9PROT|nr:TatD family hydrolase [Sulfuritortus calidifontis]TCS70848.1 TatD DNase family protein [Sulfuritortus calidifontis]